MPDDCWDNITELDKLPCFHGVIDSFETFSKEWREWYLNPEPELQPLIGSLMISIITVSLASYYTLLDSESNPALLLPATKVMLVKFWSAWYD